MTIELVRVEEDYPEVIDDEKVKWLDEHFARTGCQEYPFVLNNSLAIGGEAGEEYFKESKDLPWRAGSYSKFAGYEFPD